MMGVFDSDKEPPRPRFFDDKYVRKERRRKSMKQEDRVAEAVQGRRVPGSGAFLGRKGDVDAPNFLIEAKRTDSRVMLIKMDWLDKIRRETLAAQKTPALAIEFGDCGRNVERDFILISKSVFCDLLKGGVI